MQFHGRIRMHPCYWFGLIHFCTREAAAAVRRRSPRMPAKSRFVRETTNDVPIRRSRRLARHVHDDKDFYSSLIRLHVLHHAAQAPVFGLWLIEELQRHGYRIGAGTLYPILHSLERRGLLRSKTTGQGRSARRMYSATAQGRRTLRRAKDKVRELFGEIFEDEA